MGRLGKRKGKVNQFGRRPFTRGQARVDADALAQVQMGGPHLARLCCKFDLTDVADIWDNASDEDEEEPSALVSVGSYRVKIVAAPMLRCIIEKHGDIAVNCSLTSVKGRSALVQMICEIMEILVESTFYTLTESDIEDLLAVLKKMGKLRLQVGWIQKRLEEILDAKKVIKAFHTLSEPINLVQETKKAVKSYYDEMRVHLAKIEEGQPALKLGRNVPLEQEKIIKDYSSVIDAIVAKSKSEKAPEGCSDEIRYHWAKLQELRVSIQRECKKVDEMEEILDRASNAVDKIKIFETSLIQDLY